MTRTMEISGIEQMAKDGVAEAQFMLAVFHELGLLAPASKEEALRWITSAADLGYGPAIHALGERYAHGYGVEPNKTLAFKYFFQAATKEYLPAYCDVAACYEFGEGVEADPHEAFQWTLRAAEKDYRPAVMYLAFMYEQGRGVAGDLNSALRWLEKGAALGDGAAAYQLAVHFIKEGRDAKTILRWLSLAADRGVGSAHSELANAYRHGLYGLPIDLERATFHASDSERLSAMELEELKAKVGC